MSQANEHSRKLYEILARARVYAGRPASGSRLANDFFSCSPAQVSRWRTGKTGFSPETILFICQELWPNDPAYAAYWLCEIAADRANSYQVKRAWKKGASVLKTHVDTHSNDQLKESENGF